MIDPARTNGTRTNSEEVNSAGKTNLSATDANHGWLKISGDITREAKYRKAAAQKSFARNINVAGMEFPHTPKAALETIVRELDARTAAIDPTEARSEVANSTVESKITDCANEAPESLMIAAATRASGVAAIASQDQLNANPVCVGPASCSDELSLFSQSRSASVSVTATATEEATGSGSASFSCASTIGCSNTCSVAEEA